MRRLNLFVAVVALALCGCSPKAEVVAAPGETLGEGDFTLPPTPEAAAANASAQAHAIDACGPVSADGFCGVRFGMAVAAARGIYPGKLETLSGDDAPDPQACFELFGNMPIKGVSFLVEQSKIGRVDFLEEGPKSADGFGVGSDAAAIRAKYGATLKEQPNKYEPEVVDLIVEAPPGRQVFEVQDGKVRAWRAGVPPTIDYVERCG
ncbi:MAG: hypothetical protein ABI740_07905 [Alphaproteobacteria bacterium]